jgi:hypothetical protein
MMGLPGATVASLRRDLQDAIDHDVRTSLYESVLLPNSPMNEPSYREEHGITALPGKVVQETASYTRADWEQMSDLDYLFTLCDNSGMLRHVARYVRREVSLPELRFYEQLSTSVMGDPERFPALAFAIEYVPLLGVPPVSWSLLIDEVRRYLVEEVGIADDAALDTVLAVQLAHLPARERRFPDTLDLPHDYAAWHAAIQDARESGHRRDWETVIPPLRSFGPAQLTVEDPNEISALALASAVARRAPWEFSSPVARQIVPLGRAAWPLEEPASRDSSGVPVAISRT